MGLIMKRAPGRGYTAVASCDRAGCAAREERTRRTEADAAVSLVYGIAAAGWSDESEPLAFCPLHRKVPGGVEAGDRLAVVRAGYRRTRDLNAERGVTLAEEEECGTPAEMFAAVARMLRITLPSYSGESAANLRSDLEALAMLAAVAEGLTWAEVRS